MARASRAIRNGLGLAAGAPPPAGRAYWPGARASFSPGWVVGYGWSRAYAFGGRQLGGRRIDVGQRRQLLAAGRIGRILRERIIGGGLLVAAQSHGRQELARLARLGQGGVAFAVQVAPGLPRRVALVPNAVVDPQGFGLGNQGLGQVEAVFRHGLPRPAQQVGGLIAVGGGGVARRRLPHGRRAEPNRRRLGQRPRRRCGGREDHRRH